MYFVDVHPIVYKCNLSYVIYLNTISIVTLHGTVTVISSGKYKLANLKYSTLLIGWDSYSSFNRYFLIYTNFDGHGLIFTNGMSDSTVGVTQTMPCLSQSIANSYSNANCSTRGMLVIELFKWTLTVW